jgi:hypothetical protein
MSSPVTDCLLRDVGPRRSAEREVVDPRLRRAWEQALDRALRPDQLAAAPPEARRDAAADEASPARAIEREGRAVPQGSTVVARAAAPRAPAADPWPVVVPASPGPERVHPAAAGASGSVPPARWSEPPEGSPAQLSVGAAPAARAWGGAIAGAGERAGADAGEAGAIEARSRPAAPQVDARSAADAEPHAWHVEWAREGVRVWLGEARAAASSAPVSDAVLHALRRACAERGLRLLSYVRNGETIWREPDVARRALPEGDGVERNPSKD